MSAAILYHQPPLADIADSGTVELKMQGLRRNFKVVADDRANPEPNLIGFESASSRTCCRFAGPGVTASSYRVAVDKQSPDCLLGRKKT
ncbi:MAG: hypothetical protein Q7S58_00780 [Candidatus Binatus sp.]|uniref:hypothetical protein n=1 Tax=Candidatus Binatus sp. TaxID=2811406 RepID=UPI002717E376|nr:hypothetical protein [Candidatus Binatus sp.]MDO8430921.1 hypothetical protein [Candidatus Binatus sp.]